MDIKGFTGRDITPMSQDSSGIMIHLQFHTKIMLHVITEQQCFRTNRRIGMSWIVNNP